MSGEHHAAANHLISKYWTYYRCSVLRTLDHRPRTFPFSERSTGKRSYSEKPLRSPSLPLGGACVHAHDGHGFSAGFRTRRLPTSPSFPAHGWTSASIGAWVTAYRCGAVPDLHRIPSWAWSRRPSTGKYAHYRAGAGFRSTCSGNDPTISGGQFSKKLCKESWSRWWK